MGALLAQAIKEELNTDLCVINGAPIKGDMEYDSGVVTFRELKEELPFPTKMISVNMPGSVLQDAIYYSRTSGQEGQERRGFLQVDIGVVIEGQYDWLKDEPEELVHSQEHKDHRILSIGGKAFSEQNTYNVALPRNLLNGFCTIKPLMKWAEEVKLRQEAAQQLMDLERLSEAVWENEWFNYGRGKPHDGHDESHIASSSSSSRDTRNKNNTNMSSDENMIKNEKNMPQVEEYD
jgi:hypothetical protein